ncbi:hypothetical protein BUE76_14430 [Cnuella takakiae]|nr:hypothetical protein BUE76_14430 [Cnuella takakiae]
MAAQAGEYPTSTIAPALKENAHLVKRMEDIRFEIISPKETVLHKKYVYTVLDEEGAALAELEESYDGLRQVKSIEGRLLDASGKEIRTFRNKDVKDVSAISNSSIYEDSRVKRHSFDYHQYPYTVAYEVVIRFNHTFYFEPWTPQEAEGVAVEESRFTLVHPVGYALRTKTYNQSMPPTTRQENGRQITQWEVKQKAPVIRPYAAPPWYELVPVVFIGPTIFQVAGYEGNMESWQELGRFQHQLNAGKDLLPEQVKLQVQEICKESKSEQEQVVALYRYLQNNTRYISVQIGVGGWQPFDAAYVSKNRYGDCKALSNYMYSLLKEAGITSHFALVKAGGSRDAHRIMEDFPAFQFNHAVLCVPNGKDTIWLECTSQTEEPGYMSNFTGNRKALLITPEGGKLVPTPVYGLAENLLLRSMKGSLDKEGNLTLKINTRYTGIQQDEKRTLARNPDKQKVIEELNKEYDLPSYEVTAFSYQQKHGSLPEVDEVLDLDIPRFATISGKRIFIQPNLLAQSTMKMSMDTSRTCDYVFDDPYHDEDSLELVLPEGYMPEAMPKPVTLHTKYGTYQFAVQLAGNKLQFSRKVERFAIRVPATEGPELVQFWDAVYKADRSRVVLVRQE